MRLNGKVALVTGGAQGIGAAIATRFAEEGAVVFIGDLEAKAAEAGAGTVQAIKGKGGKAFFVTLDVTSEQSWVDAIAAVLKEAGKLNVLVNNAGVGIREDIEVMSLKNIETMLAVNIKGPFLGCKHAIPELRRAGGGSIINMSSVCGLIGHRYTNEAYTTTKGAVTLLTKSIAVRHAKDNIRSNCLCPSTVDTPLVQILFKDPVRKQERYGEVPLGRLATALDVANAALFLASDEASFITGVAFPVDGGTVAD